LHILLYTIMFLKHAIIPLIFGDLFICKLMYFNADETSGSPNIIERSDILYMLVTIYFYILFILGRKGDL
jgi:hypothetical protein